MWVVIHYDAIMLQRYKNFSFNPINCKKKIHFPFELLLISARSPSCACSSAASITAVCSLPSNINMNMFGG